VSSKSDHGYGRKLSLSHNLDKAKCYKVGVGAYSDYSLLASRFSREEREAHPYLVCIDMLASQYFTILEPKTLKTGIIRGKLEGYAKIYNKVVFNSCSLNLGSQRD
jgi:hypothetical protein